MTVGQTPGGISAQRKEWSASFSLLQRNLLTGHRIFSLYVSSAAATRKFGNERTSVLISVRSQQLVGLMRRYNYQSQYDWRNWAPNVMIMQRQISLVQRITCTVNVRSYISCHICGGPSFHSTTAFGERIFQSISLQVKNKRRSVKEIDGANVISAQSSAEIAF